MLGQRWQRWMGSSVDSSSPDTHDDFKPKYTPASTAGGVAEQIQTDIASHDVFVYMKGVPGAPQCGFSNMACKVLDAYGALCVLVLALQTTSRL